ncbi:sensor histidine kinase [Isoptericola hypogeus]
MATFAWALIIPASLTAPPSAPFAALLVLGLSVLGAAVVVVLWVAVRVTPSSGQRLGSVGSLVLASFALWMPAYSWAEPGELPWAWLAGFVIAASALVTWRAGIATAITLGAAAAGGGIAFDGSVSGNLLTALGCAVVVWGMGQVLVWLLRLLWAAQAGRDAESALVVAEERLRVSRELHDVLGHRLGIIALKAELAADLAVRDPARSGAQSDAIRELAFETLAEARRAVHGDTVADLSAQLTAAELVLTAAGKAATIDTGDAIMAEIPQAESTLFAAVVREAVTNILRHSDARTVSIALTTAGPAARLAIVNDGLRPAGPLRADDSGGTGLASLSARCAAAGLRLIAGPDDRGRFELRVEHAHDRDAAR